MAVGSKPSAEQVNLSAPAHPAALAGVDPTSAAYGLVAPAKAHLQRLAALLVAVPHAVILSDVSGVVVAVETTCPLAAAPLVGSIARHALGRMSAAPIVDPSGTTVAILHLIVSDLSDLPPEVALMRYSADVLSTSLQNAALPREAYLNMVAGVARFTAHALGNPLTGLSLTLDLLATTPAPDAVQRLVERCQRIAERLGEYKENLGALGGSMRSQVSSIPAESFLAELVQTHKLRSAYDLRIEVEPPNLMLPCHPGLLHNAMGYLLRNASDANPEGGTLGLRAIRHDTGVRLTVWDDGPGMLPHIEKRLFNAPVSTKKHGGGLGLLLVCMVIEQLHGGRVHYARRYPSGCEFHLDLPSMP